MISNKLLQRHFKSSDELCEYMTHVSPEVLLGFSCGKDSIATWLQLSRFPFKRIIPFYMYVVPDLPFVERSLRYYEDFFGQKILRVPSPALTNMFDILTFQPPERWAFLDNFVFERDLTTKDVKWSVRQRMKCRDAWEAVGYKRSDFFRRAIVIKKHGSVFPRQRIFYPIFDWNDRIMYQEFKKAGIRLPIDYRLFRRSFEGLNYNFLKPIRDYLPDDYEHLRFWFPLLHADIARRNFYDREALGPTASQPPTNAQTGQQK